MQSQQLPPPPRSDSPSNTINNNNLHHNLNHLKSAPESIFNPQNTHHNMYNNIHIQPEYSDLEGQKQQSKVNGFGAASAGPYRTSTAFNAFSNTRMRHQHTPGSSVQYREASQSAFNHSYPTAADVFPVQQMTSPTQQQPSSASHLFDVHQSRGFEFGAGSGSQSNAATPLSSHAKPPQFDLYGTTPPSSALLQSHQVGGIMKSGGTNQPLAPLGLHQSSQHQQPLDGYHQSQTYLSGLHLQSQTPYGPHLQTGGPGSAGTGPTGAAGPLPVNATVMNGMSHLTGPNNGASQSNVQEEISTIFVVGFPEDMQEREFQNMFTFSAGFEAATLKIPNKEYTAYGGPGGNGPGSMALRQGGLGFTQYGAGSNDPYNLVTVNQGGVVVDGGRDGTTVSWPSMPSNQVDPLDANGHFGPTHAQNAMPPRKQIIGFAKFRSRQEALDARDVLQGRRVDIEKGAVLKAEMAKKNLHTKRGVGLMGVGVGATAGMSGMLGGGNVSGGGVPNDSFVGITALNLNGGIPGGGEVMSAREKELGTLGAMGFAQWRDHRGSIVENGMSREEEERRKDREPGALTTMGLGAGTRGPRERAEDDEREKRRREKEARLRSSNSTAFDAFHSVPPQAISRAPSNSLLSPTLSGSTAVLETGATLGGNSPMLSGGFAHQMSSHSPSLQTQLDDFGSGNIVGPWDSMDMNPPTSATLPVHPSSESRPSSPPNSGPFSPSANNNVLPSHPSLPIRPRPFSPSNELSQQQLVSNAGTVNTTSSSSVPTSSASSSAGESQNDSVDADMARSVDELAVSTGAGNISPQLPSPGSSGSSGAAKANIIDQNPPINTLYVGNLPTSQVPPGYPTNYLEESLRELFQRRPGYRKLCFRHKSNGPMCFVEFEDVGFAARALNDLYGNTLNGLVKGGGIRLSYSKNPLGVRTPTSAGGSGPSLQQQQQHNNALQQGLASPFPPDAFQSRPQADFDSRSSLRRDMSNTTSPHPSYGYATSPPPPRFFSPPPVTSSFNNTLGDGTHAFPRVNNGYAFPPPSVQSSMSNFSPFGISSPPQQHSSIPEQTSSELQDHFTLPNRAISPPANIV